MAEQRDNQGTLNRNTDKDESHPNWPDFKGQAVINGVPYWISGWSKTATIPF